MLLCCFLLRAKRALVITPSRLVRDQIADGFQTMSLFRSLGVVPADLPPPRVVRVEQTLSSAAHWEQLRKRDVVVGTVNSVSPALSRVARPPGNLFDLILVDEAHHSPAKTWKALLDAFPGARRVLFTATPFRRDDRHIHGRFVFSYDLRRARDDGVFGRLDFQEVQPAAGEDPDLAMAKAAEAKIAADRGAGLDHRLMVRTATQQRAEDLGKLYASKTKLKLQTLLAKHSLKHARGVIAQLKDGSIDGLICVDMLGEGFDLPQLKVAALHSPHRSLAVTLQFVGRFARTTGTNVGDATFLAVPSEIEIEAHRLYVPGAEWNELVAEAAATKIDHEKSLREYLDAFTFTAPQPDSISLHGLNPYFHVKVLRPTAPIDLARAISPVSGAEVLLDSTAAQNDVRVIVTREVTPAPWSNENDIVDVRYDLFILYHRAKENLLFICSSRRDIGTYDELASSVSDEQPALLAPDVLNRVLVLLANPEFFSIGLRNRSAFGHSEAYRMITGPAADRAIQKADGRTHHRGHWFGRGRAQNGSITLGGSSSSKVWSNKRGRLPELLQWCRELAKCIASSTAAKTGSGLDHLPVGRGISALPTDITTAALPESVYRSGDLLLRFPLASGKVFETPLLDCDVSIISASATRVQIALEFAKGRLELEFVLSPSPRWTILNHASEDVVVVDPARRTSIPLQDLFNEDPPTLYTASLATLSGGIIVEAPTIDEPFDLTRIEAVSWSSEDVNPKNEKPSVNGVADPPRFGHQVAFFAPGLTVA